MRKFKASTSAFTLIEVLVALFIFVISFVALSANATYILKYQRINEERQQALLKAGFLLNRLMSLDYSSTCLTVGSHNCANDDGTCCGDYKGSDDLSWTIVDGPDSGITKRVSVVVNFRYQNYQGNVQLSSIKGEW